MHRLTRIAFGLLALTVCAAADSSTPRVTAAWTSGLLEVHLALDRPVDSAFAARLVATEIQFGGDESSVVAWRRRGAPSLKPPIGTLKVVGARLTDGGRTLVLATDPHPRDALYVLRSPLLGAADPKRRNGNGNGAAAGLPVAYDLTGAAVTYSEDRPDATPGWQGWWPDLDAGASRTLTRGSAEHERGFARLDRPGRVSLESLVALPKGRVTLRIAASGPVEASLDGENAKGAGGNRAEFPVESTGEPSLLVLSLKTGSADRPLSVRVTTQREGEPSETPLPRERQLVPWVPAPVAAPSVLAPPDFPLGGGNPGRGEAIFFGEQAKCGSCHKVGGKGGNVGPDLGSIADRTPLDIYRDIAEPSATINPDFVPYTVSLKDGRVLVGIVRAVGSDVLQVTDTDARATQVRRAEIDGLRPGTTSIMPVGLAGAIGESAIRDLIAFLTSRPAGQAPSGKR